MIRPVLLGGLLVTGGLLAAAGQPAPPAVRMQSLNVSDNLYILSGAGGNSLALALDSGVILVDTMLPGAGRPILDALRGVTDSPVTTIINTHSHTDHTGGNVEFTSVADVIAHQNTRARMAKLGAFAGSAGRFLPGKTFPERLSLLQGIDRIEVHYFGRAHTDGDAVVVFPEKRVAHVGDLFASKAAPFVDVANGGSALEYPETLAKAVTALAGVTTIVTGHIVPPSGSPVRGMTTIKDLQEFADFNRDFVAAVREAHREGKSASEAASTLRLPDRYRAYGMDRSAENIRLVYEELAR